MTFGKRVRQLRRDVGLTCQALADRINEVSLSHHRISRTTITMWETRPIATPRMDHVVNAAKVLGVTTDYLMNGSMNTESIAFKSFKSIKNIPLFNATDAIPILEKSKTADQFITVDKMLAEILDENAFAMYVSDPSMQPVLNKNDIVVVANHIQPEPGDIVAFKHNKEPVLQLRRYTFSTYDQVVLQAINPDWHSYPLDSEVRIYGVVGEIRNRMNKR